MATTVITNTTPYYQDDEYLTLAEYKNAPTAIDIDNLVVGGTAAQQDAELNSVIGRASSWINTHLNQSLIARAVTEQNRTRMTPQGNLIIRPEINPIIAFSSLSYGASPTNLTPVTDLSPLWFESDKVIYPVAQTSLSYSSQGPLAFGFPPSSRSQIYVSYNYTAGYVNTLGSGSAGSKNVTVTNPVGILPGQIINFYDGQYSERLQVATNYTYGANPVTLTTNMAYAHTNAAFSGMPAAVKEAAILVVTDFLKVRGDNSLTMAVTTRPSSGPNVQDIIGSDLALAKELLRPFRKVR
jgi:hypothetical protein